jgi:hypothetical protein
MSTPNSKSRIDAGAASLWASAFVVMAMIITQASDARLGKEARADVTTVGSLTVTNIQSREDADILMILNDAQERLYIYGLEQGRTLELLQSQDLAEIFASARR